LQHCVLQWQVTPRRRVASIVPTVAVVRPVGTKAVTFPLRLRLADVPTAALVLPLGTTIITVMWAAVVVMAAVGRA